MNRRLPHLLAALLLLAAAPHAHPAPAIAELDRVVAVVNDDVITRIELDERVEAIGRQLLKNNTPIPPAPVLQRQVLERLILERIQLAQAEGLGIRVDDEALNQVIGRIAAENGLTLLQFREVLARDGYDFAQFREEIRREMMVSQLRTRQVENRVSVSPQEVEQYLAAQAAAGRSDEEYHLYHILVALPETPSPEQVQAAREKAEGLYRKVTAGADFRETAVAHSDGQQALEGGDLGWRAAGQLPTFISGVVATLEPGEVSEPVRSPSGFHILKLAEKRGGEKHIVQQTHARHILIRPNELVSDFDAEKRLERLRRRVLAGEDFAALARAHSEDPGSAAKGGDLGWSDPGKFVPRFEEAMAKLAPGEISAPFRSQFGWHIVQVLARRAHDNTEEYRRTKAHEALRQRKIDESTQQWLRQLRDEAYVEYRLEG